MVTVEADVVVGHILKQKADVAGVLYSMAYGDEPALAYELWDWAKALGFRVVGAGKGTRFLPSFRKYNPDDVPAKYGFSEIRLGYENAEEIISTLGVDMALGVCDDYEVKRRYAK